MRKALMVVGAVIAVVAIAVAAVLIYAARNLDSIIAERQAPLLQKISDSLGRKVEVSRIRVTLGWGIMAELIGLKIQDDPALSDQPFVQASEAYAKVELLPLLSRRIHVSELRLTKPEVRIIRTEQGSFNLSTLGKRRGEEQLSPNPQENPPPNPKQVPVEGLPLTEGHGSVAVAPKKTAGERLGAIYAKELIIDDGVIVYEERGKNHQSITISNVDLTVNGFGFTRRFDFALKLTMLSDKQNVDISGTIGPLGSAEKLDIQYTHFAIQAKIGPLELARLRAIGALGKSIPDKLSVPDPISLQARADGTPAAINFHVESDLSANRVAWDGDFIKPASTPLNGALDGKLTAEKLDLANMHIRLDDLDAKLHDVAIAQGGNLSAHLDTNRFDVASIAKMVPALQKYNASGQVEVHSDLQYSNRQPRAHGTVSLAVVSLSRPAEQQPFVSDLSGDLRLNGNTADVGPLKFDLAGGHATLSGYANSIEPLSANYVFNIDTLKVAALAPTRPADEYLKNLALNGSVAQGKELSLNTKASASEGNLANVAFKDLKLAATMLGPELHVQSLDLSAFSGSISASGNAALDKTPQFALDLTANNIDMQSALQSLQSKSADMIRGKLDAQLDITGTGAKFDAIKPTLAGKGRATIRNAKLVGVNLAVEALKKTKGLPGIGDLVPEALIQRHPELFNNPDTDIDSGGLSFVLGDERITTHDLVVQTPDYGMTGDGWFDMDKNIEMNSHVLLTRQFSKEFIAEKKNIVYLTNKDGEVDIPMMVTGQLPKPTVVPDVADLAQRAAGHLLERNVGKLLGKGKGLNIPFVNDGGGSKSSGNPINQLKGLFH